jgi:hypothetical protein
MNQPIHLAKIGKIVIRPIVCYLLFGGLLLAGCGQAASDQPAVTGAPAPETMVPPEQPAEEEAESVSPPANSTGDSISVGDVDPVENDSAGVEPQFGEITFAPDVTEAYQPIDPGFLFTQGITEIHALFEYRNMSTDHTWERIWYLSDREVARSSGPWTEPERGIFDYYIDNGGEPLPAGDWILELYVEGKLRSLGVFIIEPE